MGLLDKFKSNMGSTIEKKEKKYSTSKNRWVNDVESFNEKILKIREDNIRKEIDKRENNLRKEMEKVNKIRAKFNIYKGINCKIQFPQQELVLKSHSGLKRGIATFAFVLVGFATQTMLNKKKTYN